jgi:predicted secreted hydrolase
MRRAAWLGTLVALACAAGAGIAAPGAPALPAAPAFDAGQPFTLAVPPYTFAFPRDHASHPGYQTEWWYYTGHVQAASGRAFGYELTFFRVGLPRLRASSMSAWAVRDLLFVHMALTDERGGKFVFHDAVLRPALGLAGADTTRYHVWLDASSAQLAGDGVTHLLRAVAPEFALDLAAKSLKPPAIHGTGGVSQKTAGVGNASHYYSLTRMATSGSLRVGGDSLAVTGTSWMDHEYGSGSLTAQHAGWDWFSLQLDDGRELMLYALRMKDGSIEPLSAGSLIERDGSVRHLKRADFAITAKSRWKSATTGADYPSGWHLSVPAQAIELDVTPTVRDQELVARAMGGVVYWEGSCRVRGTSHGVAVSGMGYTELTGYTGRAPY